MENNLSRLVSIRDLHELQDVNIKGFGDTFTIGFTGNGSIAAEKIIDDDAKTSIFVPLFNIVIGNPEGITLTPLSRDLKCVINGSEVENEINLDSGTTVFIAERELLIVEGPLPRIRRKLPNPPGSPLTKRNPSQAETEDENTQEESGDSLITLNEWQVVNKPIMDPSVMDNLDTPEQISNFTASLICKQIQLFTDSSLSFENMDDIFKFFKKISSNGTQTLMQFLKDMNQAVQNIKPEDRDLCPVHGPIITLLMNIIRLHLDMVDGVLLCFQLLRTFSHFPVNHQVFVEVKGVATILGAMVAYKHDRIIQTHGMDVIANVATYKPKVYEKAPIRETVIEMILHTIKNHRESVAVVQRGCRILANICVMNFELVNHLVDTETLSFELKSLIKKHMKILDYAEKLGVPFIQSSLEEYNDIDIKTEGRRFLFIYSKTHHLKQKVRSFLQPLKYDEYSLESNNSVPALVTTDMISENTKGILKKSGSYENLRNPERKLKFVDSDSSDDSDSYTSSDFDAYESRDIITSSVPLPQDESLKIIPMATSVEQEIGSQLYFNEKTDSSKSFTESKSLEPDNDVTDSESSDSDLDIISDENSEEFMIQEHVKTSEKDTVITDIQEANVTESVVAQMFTDSFLNKMQNNIPDVKMEEDNLETTLKKENMPSSSDKIISPKVLPSSFSSHHVSPTEVFGAKVPLLEDIPYSSDECENCAMSHDTSSLHDGDDVDCDMDIHGIEKDKLSWSDVKFTQMIVKSEVCFHVCLMMLQGQDSDALQIMDQPLRRLLPGYNPKKVLLHRFVEEQYSPDVTFVDLDPSLIISIIDASRYRTLAHNLMQDMMSNLTKNLRDVIDSCILSIGINCIKSALYNNEMESVWKDSEFLVDYSALFSDATKLFSTMPGVLEIKKRLVLLH